MSAENPDQDQPEPGFSFTDKRRIDPQTGEVRGAEGEPAEEPAGASAGVPDDLSGLEDAQQTPEAAAADADAAPGAEGESALAAERLEDLQRLNAEYAAFRMRAKREQDRARDAGVQEVIEALFPVLDEVKLARENGDVTGAFEIHADKLVATLEKLGLEQYGEVGEEFDPNIHDALMQQHSDDVESPTVFLVMQPGYRLGDRVIRAARVGVQSPTE